MEHMLNYYWDEGPHLLNDLLGVLIRFRENNIAMIGDIKKMYHTVKMAVRLQPSMDKMDKDDNYLYTKKVRLIDH